MNLPKDIANVHGSIRYFQIQGSARRIYFRNFRSDKEERRIL